VAILYVGGIFTCRHCYRLAYPSQREANYNRLARQANKLRGKLGWETGCFNPPSARNPGGCTGAPSTG